jgi:hypothetical protein
VTQRTYVIRKPKAAGMPTQWHIYEDGGWNGGDWEHPLTKRPFVLNKIDHDLQGVLVWCLNTGGERMVYIAHKMTTGQLATCKPRKTIARGTYAELWPQLLSHGEML